MCCLPLSANMAGRQGGSWKGVSVRQGGGSCVLGYSEAWWSGPRRDSLLLKNNSSDSRAPTFSGTQSRLLPGMQACKLPARELPLPDRSDRSLLLMYSLLGGMPFQIPKSGCWRDGGGKARHSSAATSSLTLKRFHRSVSRRAPTLFTARPSRQRMWQRREASDADAGSRRASAARQVYQARDFAEAPKRNVVHERFPSR